MRFTLNAFIVSTVALLSLTTSVVNAQNNGAEFTSPTAGQTVNMVDNPTISAAWTVTDPTVANGGVNIGLVVDSSDPFDPQTARILNTQTIDVSSGQAEVTFPTDVTTTPGPGQYFLQLISTDTSKVTSSKNGEPIFATSAVFNVVA